MCGALKKIRNTPPKHDQSQHCQKAPKATQDEGFEPWVAGETYRLAFDLSGSTSEMRFEVSRLVGSAFVSQGSAAWNLPSAEWAFDSLGVGNLLDDQALGGFQVARIDNFAFIPSGPTCSVLLVAGLAGAKRRRRTSRVD